MTLDALLHIALGAVERAASIVRQRRPGVIVEKADRDLVSETDLSVERAVRAFLRERTPDIGFVGEEEGIGGGSNGSDLVWTLDPIDGTSNYVRGLPLCAISLALVDGTSTVLGVIDLPFLDSRYRTVVGRGAYLGDTRLRTSRTRDLREAIVAVGDYATGNDAAAKNRDRLGLTQELALRAQRIRMLGTAALDLAWLAEGKLDAAVMLSNKPWDTLAGVLLAREAGAFVYGRSGESHDADSTATVACANEQLATEIVALITSLGLPSTS
jgi:myo-inositol-1(or 4)-monophosphatase